MHRILRPVVALVLFAATACQPGTPYLETENQKASYGIGLQMGEQLGPAESHLDMSAFLAGLRAGMAGEEPPIPLDELQAAVDALARTINVERSERRAADAERNSAEGEAFLAENAAREGVVVTESGLQYEVIREGDGPRPGPSDQVSVHYRGTLIDGTEFDSSYGGEPAQFGVGGVIAGFSEGLQLMTVGSHYRLYIPAELGYGARGAGAAIGPNATLIFDLELLEVVQ